MKTTKTKSNKSDLQSRPKRPITGANTNTRQQPPAAASARVLPYVNFEQREQNCSLSTDQVLDLLRQWLPEQFHLAEVVGKWIWIPFPEPPAEKIRGQLSLFGFHWNNHRRCWQHPCGQFAAEGSGTDPRTKYGSHLATELKAA